MLSRIARGEGLSGWVSHKLSAALLLPAQNIPIDGFCIVVEGCGILVSQPAHLGEDRVFYHVSLSHQLGGRTDDRRLEAMPATDALHARAQLARALGQGSEAPPRPPTMIA